MTESSGVSITLTVANGATSLKVEEMTLTTRGGADRLSELVKLHGANLPVRLYPTKAKVKPKANSNRPAARPSLARAASEGAATEAARD